MLKTAYLEPASTGFIVQIFAGMIIPIIIVAIIIVSLIILFIALTRKKINKFEDLYKVIYDREDQLFNERKQDYKKMQNMNYKIEKLEKELQQLKERNHIDNAADETQSE